MIQARMSRGKTTPWWAVIGAPLVGVPLLVALLSLVAPQSSAEMIEPENGQATEQMEVTTVGLDADVSAADIEQHLQSC